MSNCIYIVYETTNLVNGKYYIGVHRLNGKKYLGSGKILKQAVLKYGRENFIRETLKLFDNENDAYEFERIVVNSKLLLNNNCYNIIEGGGKPPIGFGKDNNFYGKTHSDESLKKISENRKGKICGKEHPNFGKPLSPETKEKLSISKSKICKKQHNEIIDLCLSGMLISDIAKKYDVAFQTVYTHLKEDERCIIQMNKNRSIPHFKISDKDVNKMRKMCIAGRNLGYIGKQFNIHRVTVSKYLNRYKDSADAILKNKYKSKLKISLESIIEAKEMKDEGHTLEEIGKKYGVHSATMSRYLREEI